MLQVRTQGPGHAFRYAPAARTPRSLPPGQVRLLSQLAVASILVEEGPETNPLYTMDFHVMDLAGGFEVGLPGGFTCELVVRERRPVNARLDPLIMDFHDAVGVEQNGRENVTPNDFRISVPPYDIELGDAYKEPFRRTLELSLQKTVVVESDYRPAIALGATVALLADDSFYSDAGDLEGSAYAGATKRFGRHYAHASIAWAWYASRDPIPLPFEDTLLTGALGWEWRSWDRHAFLLECMISQGAVAGLGRMDRAANDLRLGYRLRRGAAALELGLAENFLFHDNSADIVFHVALSYDLD